jgi:flavin reductase (DIM6/NTAB) family NADH-FMN oxidoreductase RutF
MKMITITRKEIAAFEKIYRANLINGITGYKPANLIGTISETGHTNVAIISSVFHMGSDPALIGFMQRPVSVRRDTYENIRETGCYTINHVHGEFIEKAHQTSARFDQSISEFDACNIQEEYLKGFRAPFVKESKVKIGMNFVEEIPIRHNKTILMIGEIEVIQLASQCLEGSGNLDLNIVNDVCISGLSTYHQVSHKASFSYAKPDKQLELVI